MARSVIGPTLGRTSEDVPRINGTNFSVWNARIRGKIDDQSLLGFIDQDDDFDSLTAKSDGEDPEPHKPRSG
ncbi:unnamed protein product [Phytophthora fragariaefolia]|uniref:Unnamed protein product n=1 Tax=Phytophthora fragariaefolia TaxID=1490495 RepID=A0A9W7CW95_9STRA|nr:unnamed protein product [Phytophthora fragariaefolia]